MRIEPRGWIGVLLLVLYAAWVCAVWMYQGLDYRQVGAPENLVPAIIMPLSVAAIALVAFIAWARWGRPVFFETGRARHPVFLGILLVLIAICIAINFSVVDLAALDRHYLLVLALAMLLVGFCEEVVTRGTLLVGLRGSCKSEVGVWFWSSLLFGALHALNGLFGLGALALVQVLFAFCAGTWLYLLRRLTGTLVVPILVHALWDFSTFMPAAGKVDSPASATVMLMVTHLTSLVLVGLLLRHDKRQAAMDRTAGGGAVA